MPLNMGVGGLGEEREEEEKLPNKQWSDKRPLSPQEKKGPGKHLRRDTPPPTFWDCKGPGWRGGGRNGLSVLQVANQGESLATMI